VLGLDDQLDAFPRPDQRHQLDTLLCDQLDGAPGVTHLGSRPREEPVEESRSRRRIEAKNSA
jgi:hypothetical protein